MRTWQGVMTNGAGEEVKVNYVLITHADSRANIKASKSLPIVLHFSQFEVDESHHVIAVTREAFGDEDVNQLDENICVSTVTDFHYIPNKNYTIEELQKLASELANRKSGQISFGVEQVISREDMVAFVSKYKESLDAEGSINIDIYNVPRDESTAVLWCMFSADYAELSPDEYLWGIVDLASLDIILCN